MSAEPKFSIYAREQARDFTDEIKRDGQALSKKIAEAYRDRIWITLGYEEGQSGWHEYVAQEFPDARLVSPSDRINGAIERYLRQGLSTRAIAKATGVSSSTVARRAKKIREDSSADTTFNGLPGSVQGIDGKQYASQRERAESSNSQGHNIIQGVI